MPKSAKRCQEIRQETKAKIIHDAMLYFARNGFAGTKISDLAKSIGIAQGTMYIYFKSKEELFHEIYNVTNNSKDIKELKILVHLPFSAKQKIQKLSKEIITKLQQDDSYAAKVALNAQLMFEKKEYSSMETTYQTEIYQLTNKIILQGQKEGSVVTGESMKLVDYYWGVIYLYALKKLFTVNYEFITSEDLARILIKDN